MLSYLAVVHTLRTCMIIHVHNAYGIYTLFILLRHPSPYLNIVICRRQFRNKGPRALKIVNTVIHFENNILNTRNLRKPRLHFRICQIMVPGTVEDCCSPEAINWKPVLQHKLECRFVIVRVTHIVTRSINHKHQHVPEMLPEQGMCSCCFVQCLVERWWHSISRIRRYLNCFFIFHLSQGCLHIRRQVTRSEDDCHQ